MGLLPLCRRAEVEENEQFIHSWSAVLAAKPATVPLTFSIVTRLHLA